MNTRIREAMNVLRDFGFHNSDDITSTLYRVVKTKALLGENEIDSDMIYEVKQKETDHLVGRFPGDSVIFYRLYRALSALGGQDIICILNNANGSRELMVPAVLTHKIAEQITNTTTSVLVTECEKYGLPLYEVISRNPDVRFVLTCQRELQKEILSIA